MPTLDLSHEECSQLMNRLIATDPLLMKIGEQLRRQQQEPPPSSPPEEKPVRQLDGNGKEVQS